MIQLIGKQGKTFYMITETIILPAKLPDAYLTYLNNAFKSAYYLLVEIELTPENTLVKLTSNNSSGIIQAAKELGREGVLIELGLSKFIPKQPLDEISYLHELELSQIKANSPSHLRNALATHKLLSWGYDVFPELKL